MAARAVSAGTRLTPLSVLGGRPCGDGDRRSSHVRVGMSLFTATFSLFTATFTLLAGVFALPLP